MSKYGVFSGRYFPAFGLNAERYGVSMFKQIFLHHNQNGTGLLSPESECTSCLKSWRPEKQNLDMLHTLQKFFLLNFVNVSTIPCNFTVRGLHCWYLVFAKLFRTASIALRIKKFCQKSISLKQL